MPLTLHADPVPIREDARGALRVGDSRVLLDLVIHAFDDGATPESIVQSYDTLRLPDVYAVIAYYLRHPEEIRRYLSRREAQAEAVRRKIEAAQGPLVGIRERLLSRRPSGSVDAEAAQ